MTGGSQSQIVTGVYSQPATTTSSPMDSSSNVRLREQSHLDLQNGVLDTNADTFGLEDRLCPGCKKSAVNNEQGGLVVAFG